MTGLKTMLLGVLTLAATTADVQAFGKKNRGGGSDCNCAAPCNPCATGGNWRAEVPPGGAPMAMPGRGTTGVIPADGTRIAPDGTVIPASGTVQSPGVIPATSSYYYDPRTGSYYQRGGVDNQGFVPGIIQGSTGNYYYPSMSPSNYAGRRLGGLFRR